MDKALEDESDGIFAESKLAATDWQNCFKSNCTKNYSHRQIWDITFYREVGLQIHQICLQLKTLLQLLIQSLQSCRHWRHLKVVFGNLGDQFLWLLCKISSVRCMTYWRQLSETKETLFVAAKFPSSSPQAIALPGGRTPTHEVWESSQPREQ